jgi:hypothetical protein
MTRHLIEEKGFSAVAVEGDWPDAYRVNMYVRDRTDDWDAEESLRPTPGQSLRQMTGARPHYEKAYGPRWPTVSCRSRRITTTYRRWRIEYAGGTSCLRVRTGRGAAAQLSSDRADVGHPGHRRTSRDRRGSDD